MKILDKYGEEEENHHFTIVHDHSSSTACNLIIHCLSSLPPIYHYLHYHSLNIIIVYQLGRQILLGKYGEEEEVTGESPK